MTYATLMNGGFVKGLVEQRRKNPRSIWVSNNSCETVAAPDVTSWLTNYRSLQRLFTQGTAASVKPYIKDLLSSGRGNDDAAAVTVAIAGWTLPAHLRTGGHDVGKRHVLVASASLNQDINRGQVHAEHISTGVVLGALDDVRAHYEWGAATMDTLEVLIYTGKWKAREVTDFLPCGSCQRTLKDVLQPYAAQIESVWSLGKGIELD